MSQQKEHKSSDSATPSKEVALCDGVKSSAVVQYEGIDMPAQFQELRPTTDLNQPPPNWLHGSTKWESYLQDISLGKRPSGSQSTELPFSSFKIAHSFPDLTGEVDVVSDAENIKKLLKMPWSKSQVSLMVHRVGNTLLLEEFDVHRHLLRQQVTDWQWLRHFYYSTVLAGLTQDKCVVKKNKSRDHLQSRNMFSKFLYYSVAGDSQNAVGDDPHQSLQQSSTEHIPKVDTATETGHQRNMVWTFEDIRMLIGTDLPIFGGGTHPCVSLRLRDMQKPINVLTGLDYWLDNLMCNVPELAMCYHLNGIVQSYELIKTEDIPNMDNSEFSPSVMKDIAQNILSFLKSNATREGHTYWLYKGQDDEVVKLYDLTTLCPEVQEEASNNPYTVPVGILLYRVARNMRQRVGRKRSGTIRTLLKNCLQLLDEEKYSQVVTSAHLLLSDLYVSDSVTHLNDLPYLSNNADSETEDEEEEEEEEIGGDVSDWVSAATPKVENSSVTSEGQDKPSISLDVQALCVSEDQGPQQSQHMDTARHPPISGSMQERCREALVHIIQGLKCLKQNVAELSTSFKHLIEEQVMCNPDEAIPLHYKPVATLSPRRMWGSFSSDSTTPEGAESPQAASSPKRSICFPDSCLSPGEGGLTRDMHLLTKLQLPQETWHTLSKALLLRKAALCYYGLAESMIAVQKYGASLKYLKNALTCYNVIRAVLPSKADENIGFLSYILGLLGDAHVMLARVPECAFASHREEYLYQLETDANLMESLDHEAASCDYACLQDFSTNIQHNLCRSVLAYKLSLDYCKKSNDSEDRIRVLTLRLGNAQNELGVHCMNQSATLLGQNEFVITSGVRELWTDCEEALKAGIDAFTSISDKVNVALVFSNRGRLQRLQAQAHRPAADTSPTRPGQPSKPLEFTAKEKAFYIKAQESYTKALAALEQRELSPDIWDSITWELSTTCYQAATQLQDHAPLSTNAREQVEQEVIVLMKRALQYCEVDAASPRATTCQYRAATIHHRLASLHHNAYRCMVGDGQQKSRRSEAEHHYTGASALFLQLNTPCELLRVQLERVALCEHQLTNQTSSVTKLRTLSTTLQHLLACQPALQDVHSQMVSMATEDQSEAQEDIEGFQEEAVKLINIFESRLNFVLFNQLKNWTSSQKGQSSKQTDLYKSMYAASLKKASSDTLADICLHLLEVVTKISSLHSNLISLR